MSKVNDHQKSAQLLIFTMAADAPDIEVLRSIPPSARAVIPMIKALRKRGTIEDWRHRQLIGFLNTLIQTTAELAHAYKRKRLSSIAWLTRNLLELSIWVDFCSLSPEHARRFHEDILRDSFGFARAFQLSGKLERQDARKFVNDVGAQIYGPTYREPDQLEEQGDPEVPKWTDELTVAARSLGIDELSDKAVRPLDAAKELGRDEFFLAMNKILSKFAHATTMIVYSGAFSGKFLGVVDDAAEIFLNVGVRMAYQSLGRILQHLPKD
jgi:polyhydroxyalkanoate synthesis regulator phasin